MKNGKTTPLCVKCGETDTSKISASKKFKNGFRSQCKACDKAHYEAVKESRLLKCKEYRDTKLDKVKAAEYSKEYRDANKDTLKAKKSLYYEATKEQDKERRKLYGIKYRILNRGKRNAERAKRRAVKVSQTPGLTSNEKNKITLIYKIASFIKKSTGVLMHVDHIIPLSKGGLHHPLNLQVITQYENLSKGCTMPSAVSQELKDLHNNFYGEIKYE